MKVEIISVGSELLCGNIRDLNAPFIASKLTELGLDTIQQTIVGDNFHDLKLLLQSASKRSNLIIITGGLGPTIDDITREAVSEFCNVKLVTDKNAANHIESLIQKAHSQKCIKSLNQAMIPEGSTLIHNSTGTAQGFVVNATRQSKIICLPGVPAEMEFMFNEWIVPYINRETGERKKIFSKVINTFGISEPVLDEKVKEIIKPDEHLSYSTLVNDGVVSIYITIRNFEDKKANSMFNDVYKRINGELGEFVFSIGKQPLEEIISNLMKKNNLKLATAESCTGGLVSNLLTNIPGSSNFFTGGLVSYSNNIKKNILKVPEKLIKHHGVISAEVAEAMANGVRDYIKTDIGLAVTGNAGPTSIQDGADQGKPVGLVYVAATMKGNSMCKKYHFFGTRLDIKRRTANAALNILRLCLLEKQTLIDKKICSYI